MGCGGSTEKNKAVDPEETDVITDRRQKISVRIGPEVKKLDTLPRIIFVFGGPGSRKGRVVDDLVSCYQFKFLNCEDLVLEELPRKLGNVMTLENTHEIQSAIKEDASHLTIPWLLEIIARRIELNRNGSYLVDFMPNLKSMLRNECFSSASIRESMQAFEDKYKIAFALNLAVPADKVLNATKACTPADMDKLKKEGGQSDEADSSRTQKRASLYATAAKPFLDYFSETDRLLTVDVSSGQGDFIWNKVNEVLCDLQFEAGRTVNTIILFQFDGDATNGVDYNKFDMEKVHLKLIADDPNDSEDKLLSALCKYIDSRADHFHNFLVDVSGTSMTKKSQIKVANHNITFVGAEECFLENYVWFTPKHQAQKNGCTPYKAVFSTENEVCFFPRDTDSKMCSCVAAHMAWERMIK